MPLENCTLQRNAVQALPRLEIDKRLESPTKEPNGHPPRRSWSVERSILHRLWLSIGQPQVRIELWDGQAIGPVSNVGRVVIRQPRVLWQLCLQPSVAFGEAYSRGELDIEGDLVDVLEMLNRGLARSPTDLSPSRLARFLKSRLRSHSVRASKAAVHHHYDLGNDFYRLWLDEQLVYTCAYYSQTDMTLEAAQSAKLDYVCRKLRLQPGERVAEAGCGWGALALHMAREYGVTVQAFNLSREQLAYARQRAQSEGLSHRVEFIEDDYRSVRGQFDAFVSVGMLEHVGRENLSELGRVMDRALTPSGRGLVHSIGRNAPAPLDPWTDKYIFPGAYPPSLCEMLKLLEVNGFSVLDVENLRLHYAKTCKEWLNRFDEAAQEVTAMFDEHFVRLWRLYLAASAAAFLSGDLQLFQVVFARPTNNSLPWTRADWYGS
jgi:cyclopropane-fatty-acyl-phospholipid synthase